MAVKGFEDKVNLIWDMADLLRGDFRPHEFGSIVLPFVLLRRLDDVLKDTREDVWAEEKRLEAFFDGDLTPLLEDAAGQRFYNRSKWTFASLLGDSTHLEKNLKQYIGGFSSNVESTLDNFRINDFAKRLNDAGLLYPLMSRLKGVDLHPDTVPNDAMGYIFEELLRKFSEMSNETAGEHFTPREVIKLMVNILFSTDQDDLEGAARIRSLFDPTCGTGVMLSVGQSHLSEISPKSKLQLFGQELNPETWAIARADMMIQGEDPKNIVLGNSLTEDGHKVRTFDYMISNPPFGVKWEKIQKQLQEDTTGRFEAGLPRVADGSLLFLQHLISKMKPTNKGGSRIAIVFSGSPLFAGAAGSGESEIRKWIISNNLLEGIIALPDSMFYNTGIGTYVWVLTNRKTEGRDGKVMLLDARSTFTKMRKSLGEKRKMFSSEQIQELTDLYLSIDESDPRVKVFDNEDFGYQRIVVERPLRMRWEVTPEVVEAALVGKKIAVRDDTEREMISSVLTSLVGTKTDSGEELDKLLVGKLKGLGMKLGAPERKEILATASIGDDAAQPVRDRQGNLMPDPDLRDKESVPLTQDVDEYMLTEVLPYVEDAWVDEEQTKIGYEIPFTRHFYEYVPPRPVAEIDSDIASIEAQIQKLLSEVTK